MCGDRRKKPSVSICAGLVLGLSWIAVTGIGCQTQGSDVGRFRPKVFDPGEGPVNSIRLFIILDGEPGPDAFKARVYALRDSVPKPVPFTDGTLEIIIFDEASNRDQQDPPRQVWSFSGADLNRHRLQTIIGFSYDFPLKIDKAKPLPGKVSVVAKFTPPDGGSIFAKPVSITVEP
jgi:hypothetical protein